MQGAHALSIRQCNSKVHSLALQRYPIDQSDFFKAVLRLKNPHSSLQPTLLGSELPFTFRHHTTRNLELVSLNWLTFAVWFAQFDFRVTVARTRAKECQGRV